MDNVKKTTFEQRMVFILLAVFAVCFVQMLRRLGFIGSKARPAPTPTAVGAVGVGAPAMVQAVEQYRQHLDAVQTSQVGTVIRPPKDPAPVAAGESRPSEERGEPEAVPPRDPLVSLLPSELSPSSTTAQKGKTSGATPPTAGGGTASSAGRGGAGGGTGQAGVQPPPLMVRGVIVGGQHPQALIDDGVYGIGDLVKGARIVAIERDGVLVRVPGGLYRLSPDAGAVLVKQEVSP